MVINGKEIEAKEFGYDTCHKIYLIHTDKDREELVSYGYEIFPIDKIQEVWDTACPLRFISRADLTKEIVDQGEEAEIKL